MAYNFTVTSTTIETVPHYTGIFPTVGWTDANIANSKNRIGELKLLKIGITSSQNIKNTAFYIDPGLFLPQSYVRPSFGIPSSYWGYTVGASYTPSLASFANYQSPSTTYPQTGRINNVLFQPLTDSTFVIWIYFYQTYDCLSYTDPTFDDNHSRFLKDSVSNPSELTVSGTTVYNSTTIDLRIFIYAQKTTAPANYGYIEYNPQYGYKAGFYNKDEHEAAPYFTNPVWTLERNSVSVAAFSNVQDTVVTFECDCPVAPSAMVLRIIRADKIDNNVNFEVNYDLEYSQIVTGGPTVGKIKNPFVGPTFVAGTTYSWVFNIDKSLVNTGELYRMIAIVYYNNFPVAYEVNSFISDQIEVNADAPYYGNGFNWSGRIGDELYRYSGQDLTATIEERMFSYLEMQFPANQWKNDILARLGLTVNNDPTRYLTTIEFFIKSPDTMVTGYPNPFGETYDYRLLSKTPSGSYRGRGISLDTGTADKLIFTANWRNRYESDQANYASLINGSYVYPGTSNQNWATGALLYPPYLEIVWKFTFYYDDYIVPFTDYIVYTQKLTVKDYVADTVLKVSAQNPPFDTKDFWCNGEAMCLRGEIVDAVTINPADNYFLIANIDPSPGSIATIEQAEVFSPYQSTVFSQLTTSKIYNEDMVFGSTDALMGNFCVDESLLSLGDYKISVIAKRS